MIKLETKHVLGLHARLAQETGGSAGLRDEGLLSSALEGAFQTFGGVELYPTIPEKAARIGFSLISNHPFVDGNKRIGLLAMLVFLQLNGVQIDATNEELITLGLALAAGELDSTALLAWLTAHC